MHLYTCTPVHLFTCTPAHLYTYSPVHGDLLQVQVAEAAQLHLLGPHVHTEVARGSLQVESAVREELEMSGLFLLHPSILTWLMSRGSMGEVSPVSPAASVVLPLSPEESSLVICKARSGQRSQARSHPASAHVLGHEAARYKLLEQFVSPPPRLLEGDPIPRTLGDNVQCDGNYQDQTAAAVCSVHATLYSAVS